MSSNNSTLPPEFPLIPGDEFASCAVETATGDDVGVVQDVLIDGTTGGVAFVIVRRSVRTKVDHRLVAIPWLKFHWDDRRSCLVLEAQLKELEKFPQFDRTPEPESPGWPELLALHRQAPAAGDF
jgi:hypothetical protein